MEAKKESEVKIEVKKAPEIKKRVKRLHYSKEEQESRRVAFLTRVALSRGGGR